jgi:hypothetical protein
VDVVVDLNRIPELGREKGVFERIKEHMDMDEMKYAPLFKRKVLVPPTYFVCKGCE